LIITLSLEQDTPKWTTCLHIAPLVHSLIILHDGPTWTYISLQNRPIIICTESVYNIVYVHMGNVGNNWVQLVRFIFLQSLCDKTSECFRFRNEVKLVNIVCIITRNLEALAFIGLYYSICVDSQIISCRETIPLIPI